MMSQPYTNTITNWSIVFKTHDFGMEGLGKINNHKNSWVFQNFDLYKERFKQLRDRFRWRRILIFIPTSRNSITMIGTQEIPRHVNTDTVLHGIDLRGKVGVDWTQRHAGHIIEWVNRLQWRCEAVLGDMPPQHEYFDWFKRVTRRFIDRPVAKLILMIEGYIRVTQWARRTTRTLLMC